jgi:hypothetical protein
MHDAKTVAFAQHFLEIGGPLTVQDRMALLLSALSPVLCRFLDAGNKKAPQAQLTGVQKAPRHEVAGSLAPAKQRTLWGLTLQAREVQQWTASESIDGYRFERRQPGSRFHNFRVPA